MRTRRIALAAVIAVAAFGATLGTADAADDGYFYRLTSGTVTCTAGSIGLGSPSSVDVSYPGGATMTVQIDSGGGFGSEIDITSSLNPTGASETTTFFGASIGVTPPATIGLRWTLSVGGTPTFRQTVNVICPNAVPPDPGVEPGTLELVSEETFPTADPPADPPAGSGPATAIEAQPRTTG